MTNAKIEVKGTVEKVARINGKVEAQVVLTIPATEASNIPLGPVMLTIQTLQSALFGTPKEPMKLDGKPVKGSKK